MKITEHDNAILLYAARVMQKILGRIESVEYRALNLEVTRFWVGIKAEGFAKFLQDLWAKK